ncbi:MAG: hypothetical protein M3Q65_04800 [Chloroflexota bacterium]|nr:hypothetical protein [Chloroflexota bacterium]
MRPGGSRASAPVVAAGLVFLGRDPRLAALAPAGLAGQPLAAGGDPCLAGRL